MHLGRVIGNAVCTAGYPGIQGLKLMVVQPLNKKMEEIGVLQVAVDIVQAGPGDLCVMIRSREASLALPDEKFLPVDLALVGIIDELDIRPDDEFDFVIQPGWNIYT